MTKSATSKALPLAVLAAAFAVAGLLLAQAIAGADNNPQPLDPDYRQNWNNTGQIQTDNDWSNVPGIIGYTGNVSSSTTDIDPQTITDDRSTPAGGQVVANQTNPSAPNSSGPPGGVVEFEITNPTIALRPFVDGFDAPHIVINVDTTDRENIGVRYVLRDIDGSERNSVSRVALQYRVGEEGSFTNVPGGYTPDATTGPNLAVQNTLVEAVLPPEANDKPRVQVRIITADTPVADEFVGVDNIIVSGAEINDAPVAEPRAATTNEDEPVEITLRATDEDSDDLTFAISDEPDNGSLGPIGPVTCTGTGPFTCEAKVTYTPNNNFAGPADSFQYTASDGTNTSASATVAITVTAVNDTPVAQPQAVTADEDTNETIILRGTDAEGDDLTFEITDGPDNGTLTAPAPVTCPNPTTANEKCAEVTYDPNDNFNGADSFQFTVNDGNSTSPPATVAITVDPVNDAPVANPDTITTNEDGSGSTNVLTNDVDIDSSDLDIAAGSVTNPSNGTVDCDLESGVCTYTPNGNFNGTDSFTYRATDGTAESNDATVTVTITAVNDAPVAQPAAATTDEGDPVDIILRATDVDNQDLTFAIVDEPDKGTVTDPVSAACPTPTTPNERCARVTYTPTGDNNGADTFTFTASDGTATSPPATVTVTITAVNDQPVAAPQAVTTMEDKPIDIVLMGTDIDGDELDFEITTDPTDGTLGPIGTVDCDGNTPNTCTATVTYTPDDNVNSPPTDSFEFVVNDGTEDSEPATVTITVTPINDQPIANDDSYSTPEDELLEVPAPGVLTNDVDDDEDDLTAELVSDPVDENGDESGDLTFNEDGSFTFQPAGDFEGTVTFEYRACDEGTSGTPPADDPQCSEPATVTITVTPVDDPVVDPKAECTITGTDGDDDLEGTPGNDVICGLKGSDTIDGMASNDVIRGGRGTDEIVGSTGDDLLKGKRGKDTLDGEDGEDGDFVRGGRGKDTCTRDEGDRKKSCKDGDDTAGEDQYSTAP